MVGELSVWAFVGVLGLSPADDPDPMALAAASFLESLDAAQRESCRHEFTDAERRNWQPVPFGGDLLKRHVEEHHPKEGS